MQHQLVEEKLIASRKASLYKNNWNVKGWIPKQLECFCWMSHESLNTKAIDNKIIF
jgi:hypothetical protein